MHGQGAPRQSFEGYAALLLATARPMADSTLSQRIAGQAGLERNQRHSAAGQTACKNDLVEPTDRLPVLFKQTPPGGALSEGTARPSFTPDRVCISPQNAATARG